MHTLSDKSECKMTGSEVRRATAFGVFILSLLILLAAFVALCHSLPLARASW
jgi:hypothetical protein